LEDAIHKTGRPLQMKDLSSGQCRLGKLAKKAYFICRIF
jgi:hypothetical protein